jgi:acetyl-CoA carboxylase biotin carboxyl carrier protein
MNEATRRSNFVFVGRTGIMQLCKPDWCVFSVAVWFEDSLTQTPSGSEVYTVSERENSQNSAIELDDETLRRLVQLVENNGLSELRFEQGDLRVTLRTSTYQSPNVAPVLTALPLAALPAAGAIHGNETVESETHDDEEFISDPSALLRVEAPVMGVFYRTSDPQTPPFVEIGDIVEVGQVIGLIEAMKVFSEVPSEVAGRVKEIPAKSGALVQPGDSLVLLEPIV